MKVLYWNIRGIGNDDSQSELANICRQHHPDLVCISEPMVDFHSIPASFWSSLNLQLITMNNRGASIPNIWLLSSLQCPAPSLILPSEQHITAQFTIDGVLAQYTFIYAATTVLKRRQLWDDLYQLRQNTVSPWMAIGDCNAVLGAHECTGGRLPVRSSCDDFRNAMNRCEFTHLDTSGAFFTWSKGRGRKHMERRLDRSLCDDKWLDSFPNTSCMALPRVVSDHNSLLFTATNLAISGPKPFRFKSMWSLHSSFKNVVANCWSLTVPIGCPMYVTLQKLKALKLCLKRWNVEVFGDVHQNLKAARDKLADIQQQLASDGCPDQLFEAEVAAKAEVLEALRCEESFWRDKARVKWLKEGDKCSSFFHAYARQKQARAQINYLNDGATLLSDQQAIADHVVHFYQALYGPGTPPIGIADFCSVIPSLVSTEENIMLTAVPTSEEIKNTVFSMDPASAPGPDGFPGSFYQSCWDIVGSDVISFVQYFFQHNWLYPNANSNFIVLLPKVEGANLISQFRPIALANFLFKIIPKILADRLGPIAARIISPQQTAFLKNRRISDCIGLVSEGFNILDRKIRGGNVGIKVDIAKAFDTLDWSFLSQVLIRFGFSSEFLHFIHTILDSARLSVLLNGTPHGFFSCSRGVRQGDPLSPLLFCLAEEALSRGLTSLFLSRRVKPISLPRGCLLSHVLYADDLFIFCRGDDSSLKNLRLFLESYGAASGQIVNKDKSTFYMGEAYSYRRGRVHRLLGYKSGSAPFIYLGVPIFKGMPRRRHLQAIADKANSRLTSWKGKLLSIAGRVQLVKDIFQSMLLHSFSVYLWPSSLLKYLAVCARNFIWSGDVAIKKLVTVSWKQLCCPRNEAGLGLRHLPALNKAALLTLSWSILTASTSWGVFARGRFSISRYMKYKYFGSSIWPGLRVSLPLIFQHSRWSIGDGKLVSFWSDKWLNHVIIDNLQISRVSQFFKSSVASYISGQQWVLPTWFQAALPSLAREIMNTPLPVVPEGDILIWEDSSSGTLSFSNAYELFRPHSIKQVWVSNLWGAAIPPRFSMLTWRIFHNKLPTDDQLRKRGVPVVSVCQLCSTFGHEETLTHLFITCTFAQHVWQWLACCFGTRLPSSGTLVDFWGSFTSKPFSPQLMNLWIASGLFSFMAIWKTRNKLRFENKKPSLMKIFRSTKAWIRFIAPHMPGHYNGTLDNKLLLGLDVTPVPKIRRVPRLIIWHPPLYPWLKLNTDGLAKGNPGPAACGGVFRDCFGNFIAGYCQGLSHQTAFFSELMAVIIGVELAYQLGWHQIWLESDSTSVLSCLSSSSFCPPWPLRVLWVNCLERIRKMNFLCSHILREGNTVADKITSLGVASTSLVWYDSPPPELVSSLYLDAMSIPYYKVG